VQGCKGARAQGRKGLRAAKVTRVHRKQRLMFADVTLTLASPEGRRLFVLLLPLSPMVLTCSTLGEAAMANVRKKGSSSKESLVARIRAEYDAMGYLSKFPPEVAFIVARNVEKTLAIGWEAEQEEMIRRGDPREVLCMTEREISEISITQSPECHRTCNPTRRLNSTLSAC
jgi:hypothetical protein